MNNENIKTKRKNRTLKTVITIFFTIIQKIKSQSNRIVYKGSNIEYRYSRVIGREKKPVKKITGFSCEPSCQHYRPGTIFQQGDLQTDPGARIIAIKDTIWDKKFAFFSDFSFVKFSLKPNGMGVGEAKRYSSEKHFKGKKLICYDVAAYGVRDHFPGYPDEKGDFVNHIFYFGCLENGENFAIIRLKEMEGKEDQIEVFEYGKFDFEGEWIKLSLRIYYLEDKEAKPQDEKVSVYLGLSDINFRKDDKGNMLKNSKNQKIRFFEIQKKNFGITDLGIYTLEAYSLKPEIIIASVLEYFPYKEGLLIVNCYKENEGENKIYPIILEVYEFHKSSKILKYISKHSQRIGNERFQYDFQRNNKNSLIQFNHGTNHLKYGVLSKYFYNKISWKFLGKKMKIPENDFIVISSTGRRVGYAGFNFKDLKTGEIGFSGVMNEISLTNKFSSPIYKLLKGEAVIYLQSSRLRITKNKFYIEWTNVNSFIFSPQSLKIGKNILKMKLKTEIKDFDLEATVTVLDDPYKNLALYNNLPVLEIFPLDRGEIPFSTYIEPKGNDIKYEIKAAVDSDNQYFKFEKVHYFTPKIKLSDGEELKNLDNVVIFDIYLILKKENILKFYTCRNYLDNLGCDHVNMDYKISNDYRLRFSKKDQMGNFTGFILQHKKINENQKLLICYINLETCSEKMYEELDNKIIDLKFSFDGAKNFLLNVLRKKTVEVYLLATYKPTFTLSYNFTESFLHSDYYCPEKLVSLKRNSGSMIYVKNNCKREKSMITVPASLKYNLNYKKIIQVSDEKFDSFCIGRLYWTFFDFKRNKAWYMSSLEVLGSTSKMVSLIPIEKLGLGKIIEVKCLGKKGIFVLRSKDMETGNSIVSVFMIDNERGSLTDFSTKLIYKHKFEKVLDRFGASYGHEAIAFHYFFKDGDYSLKFLNLNGPKFGIISTKTHPDLKLNTRININFEISGSNGEAHSVVPLSVRIRKPNKKIRISHSKKIKVKAKKYYSIEKQVQFDGSILSIQQEQNITGVNFTERVKFIKKVKSFGKIYKNIRGAGDDFLDYFHMKIDGETKTVIHFYKNMEFKAKLIVAKARYVKYLPSPIKDTSIMVIVRLETERGRSKSEENEILLLKNYKIFYKLKFSPLENSPKIYLSKGDYDKKVKAYFMFLSVKKSVGNAELGIQKIYYNSTRILFLQRMSQFVRELKYSSSKLVSFSGDYYSGNFYLHLHFERKTTITRLVLDGDQLKKIGQVDELSIGNDGTENLEILNFECKVKQGQSHCAVNSHGTQVIYLQADLGSSKIISTYNFEKIPKYEGFDIDFNDDFIVMSCKEKLNQNDSLLIIYSLRKFQSQNSAFSTIKSFKKYTKTTRFSLSDSNVLALEGNQDEPLKFYQLGDMGFKIESRNIMKAKQVQLLIKGIESKENVEFPLSDIIYFTDRKSGFIELLTLIVVPSLVGFFIAVGFICFYGRKKPVHGFDLHHELDEHDLNETEDLGTGIFDDDEFENDLDIELDSDEERKMSQLEPFDLD